MSKLIESFKKYNWMSDDSITDSVKYAKKEGGIIIKDAVRQSLWEEFQSLLEDINKPILVVTDGLPKEWIKNSKLKVINTQSVMRNCLKNLDHHLKNYPFDHFHRKSTALEYDYFLMYGSQEHYREIIVKELESRSVLIDSLYSRPAVEGRPGRSIESPLSDAPEHLRYKHRDNFNFVIKNTQRCHASIMLLNEGFAEDRCGYMTEKCLWPILAQVPTVWAMNSHKRKQLTTWGFRPNDAPRNNLRSFTEQVMWLRSEFTDPIRAQRWQDEQGKTINHNLNILKGLADRIDEETDQQLRHL
tara:strand:- start:306 stop:1208 length:903 start_codon:yes stop_codon:yes gene_type:complete